MAATDVDAFLATRRHVALAMVDDTGAPDVTIVPSRFEADRLVLDLAGSEQACARLVADQRVCCAAEVCPSYYELRGVSVHGRAELGADDAATIVPDHVMSFDFSKIRERPE